ncbi:DegT/DnrJ/EryC1/StrS family aminotransferase [Candidatus Woesearchaeota archaeon]|nr:DegT/DnrJ/EryC1/StrS family aminotransferase [Candidatus Woesearchaeota archaeon]
MNSALSSTPQANTKVIVKYVDLPLQFQRYKHEILQRIEQVCESGQFILGPELERFEKDFALYCQCKHAIGVANGTDALFLVMKALGIGSGDEVITATNSFLASAGAIAAIGAKPVLVDVRDDLNIDPVAIEQAITPTTKAIIPVHLTGRPADMNKIIDIAHRHRLFVIEDAAQAVGAEYYGRKVGSLGTAAAFSLHPLKILHVYGDGGVITTNDDALADALRKLRNHGLVTRDICEQWGYNSRLDSIHAAIANVKLSHLHEDHQILQSIAAAYRKGLQEVAAQGKVIVPQDKPHEKAVYHTFIVQCNQRDALQAYLLGHGIETKVHYPIPIHIQQPGRGLGYKSGDLPHAEFLASRILSLPIYPGLTEEQISLVIQTIHSFYQQ